MNILLIIISSLYIFAVIGFSTIIFKRHQGELSRKFIHIMAYGDVLAALVGTKFKGRKPYFFAPKTLAGSVTVFIVATTVTVITILTVGKTENIIRIGIGMVYIIGLCNGFLSAFIEAAGTKGTDNLTSPLGSGS